MVNDDKELCLARKEPEWFLFVSTWSCSDSLTHTGKKSSSLLVSSRGSPKPVLEDDLSTENKQFVVVVQSW